VADKKRKTIPFTEAGVDQIPNNKPITYKALDAKGEVAYIGSAKRGRGKARLEEHLLGGPDPLRDVKKIQIQQHSSIAEAQAAEARAIKRLQPRLNKKGK